MNADERLPLLENLESLAHREAENVSPVARFLPLAAHRLALRPEIVVVRGGRGAGKSALFRVLEGLKTPHELREFFEDDRLPDAQWVDAFSQQATHHPEVGVLDGFAPGASDHVLRVFWVVHLLRRLYSSVPQARESLEPVRAVWSNTVDLAALTRAGEERFASLSQALDDVERRLAGVGHTVFATYDHLDRIGAFDKSLRRRYVSALLALWLSLSNRYQKLRAKIFLREDLFDAGELGFPDASKLRPRSVSLEWDVESLYRVVVRHLADTSDSMRQWLRPVRGLEVVDRGKWGWIPGRIPEGVQKALADRLAGELMGKGAKKGYTYRWIPNRLQDAQVRIVPRSILCLLGFAATEAKRKPLGKGVRLVTPENLAAALEGTSRARVAEIREEYPLVARLDNLRRMQVPNEATDVVQRLGRPVPEESAGLATDGHLVFDELLRLGVLRLRPDDGRVDVPDIYRYGYGILRKGGVARPK